MEIKVIASGSDGNAYAVYDGENKLLIDPGIKLLDIKKAVDFKLSGFDLCLLSHEHKDHSKSVVNIHRIGIPCAMSAGTFNALKGFKYPPEILKAGRKWSMENWIILPFDTQHDAAEPLGFLIQTPGGRKIVYATDTYYLKYKFKGVTHWLIECNYSKELLSENPELPPAVKNRIIESHFELENLKTFFRAQDLSKTNRIILIHLSKDNSDPILFVKEIETVTGKPVYIKQ